MASCISSSQLLTTALLATIMDLSKYEAIFRKIKKAEFQIQIMKHQIRQLNIRLTRALNNSNFKVYERLMWEHLVQDHVKSMFEAYVKFKTDELSELQLLAYEELDNSDDDSFEDRL